jgi:energy-coupling factor transporter ATP-binding protein EcfA2
MAAITKLEIDGFKAFPTSFSLDFSRNGVACNLLVYGENGSGKSSIYYALHAFLQSVFKSDEGAKYFRPDDTGNDEYLVNIHRIGDIVRHGYSPSIILHLDNGKVLTFNRNGISSSTGNKFDLTQLNRSSAFINHSYISRFHSARNSETIDLWPIFYKDILPFFIPSGETDYLSQIYDNINQYVIDKKPRVTNRYVKDSVDNFNKSLKNFIEEINQKVSSIYNTYFKEEGEKDLVIKLLYTEESDSENKYQERCYWRFLGIKKPFPAPHIGLYIYEIKGKCKWKRERRRRRKKEVEINKPQTYFNEAKLTAIALSIRFALLNLNKPADGRFLALDDMLISLDMSNRMKVINFLLDVVADKYRIYLFTHDRLFYSTIKKRIAINKTKNDWIMGGLYMHDIDENDEYKPCTPFPIFIKDKDMPLEMMEFYAKHDYPACGQKLRKWCEELLDKLYPDTLKKYMDPATGSTVTSSLNDRINCLEVFCEKESIDFSEFKDLKIYKDNILNTVAHYDTESPIYRMEILKIMKVLNKLNDIFENRKEIRVNHAMGIELTKPDGTPVTICFDIKKDKLPILNVGGANRVSFFVKCYVKKIIEAGSSIELPEEYVFDSIYTAYDNYCEEYGIPHTDNLLDIIKDHGEFLKNKL